MRILVIGSGGREHALCWKLAQSPEVTALYACPGNPGIAALATCVPGSDYLAVADAVHPDLTVVGPEVPLADGIVDRFQARGHAIVGPSAGAARIETSKAFAKTVMHEARIPTARHITVEGEQEALDALRRFTAPVVLKADGLAAGKGVVIASTHQEAQRAIPELLAHSPRLVIEEYLSGEEVSFIVLTDGSNVLTLEPTQDHKTVSDGDRGPNTGGMGAYCDGRILSVADQERIVESVIRPALDYMRLNGTPFTGFLYAGLMMTAEGPKVLEFNCRLGDPETQVLMHRLGSDLVPALVAAARGQLTETAFKWKPEPSVCVVLAADGYPRRIRTGDPITGIEHVEKTVVFQAGTKLYESVLTTSGGRVLGVTGSGPTLADAIATTYTDIEKIHFEGMHYRTDIGHKGLKRW
jgi:phosphoribosylamine---glycine ligase